MISHLKIKSQLTEIYNGDMTKVEKALDIINGLKEMLAKAVEDGILEMPSILDHIEINGEVNGPVVHFTITPKDVMGEHIILEWKEEDNNMSNNQVSFDWEDKWDSYLKRLMLSQKPFITETLVENIKFAREEMHSFLGRRLPPPQTAIDDEKEVFEVLWDTSGWVVSIEFLNDGGFYWFFRHKEMNFCDDGTFYLISQFLPDQLQKHLEEFKGE